jgi:flagellar hook-basal body complex protein FliE
MAISPIGGVGAINMSQLAQAYRQQVTGGTSGGGTGPATQAAGSGQVDAGTAARSSDFAGAIGSGLQQLQTLNQQASTQAIGAATGNLTDIHDYVIASTQAQTATELTTTMRNKAVEAFNQIMGMPL